MACGQALQELNRLKAFGDERLVWSAEREVFEEVDPSLRADRCLRRKA